MFLADSGLETDLIFHAGFELPEFAAFVLLEDPAGRGALEAYFRQHIDIAVAHRCGVVLESATWRASRDWAARVGYSEAELRRANIAAVELVADVRRAYPASPQSPVVISGCIGPRGDGYNPAASMSAADAEDYHREQVEVLAATAADMVHAMTLTYPAEAIGIARAASAIGIPCAISFTTETDGRLPDGSTLTEAVTAVETATGGAPAYYGINCAHPSHFEAALPDGDLAARIRCMRANASRKSHAQLDESATLDAGDPDELAADYEQVRVHHPALSILGGCCGTDVRHIEAIARTCLTPTDIAS